MNTLSCEKARGQLALASIGRLPDSERLSLESHLDGCADCRNELASLSLLEPGLAAADPDRVDQVLAVPESLRSAVLGSLGTEVARHRRSTRVRFAAAAAVVLLALGGVAIAAVAVTGSRQSPSNHTFALSGPGGARATARLTSESWGTSVDLHTSGEHPDEVLTVSMRADDGSWWVAGTYRTANGGTVDVTMSCAVPLSEINAVLVTNAEHQEVLSSYSS
ncbi:MAG: anti-sigma factor family protein [Acidimicrobiales bacterium]